MMLKLVSISLYAVKWLAWLLTYVAILPAVTLMLLIVLLFWQENSTPGKELAREIASVTRDVSPGEYRLLICRDEPFPPFNPALVKDKSTAGSAPVASYAICQKQESVITDANGYAAHIDGVLSTGKGMWLVMSIVFAGLALLMKRRPVFRLYGQLRSDLVRYGTPAGKKEDGRE